MKYPDLKKHFILFSKLEPVHMSGDESDGPRCLPQNYSIVNALWQSDELKLFLRNIDALYKDKWAHPIGKRATSGNLPRMRIEHPNARCENTPAPIGLWRNCYNANWLRDLPQYAQNDLRVIETDYSFDLLPVPNNLPHND